MMYSPLPRADLLPARVAEPCTDAEITAIFTLLRELRAVDIVLGTSSDAVSRANGARICRAWPGAVLATVEWPESAASWLRQARRFTGQAPDAWVVSASPAGWIGMGRRLACSTSWDPRKTVATASLADEALIAAGGVGTFDGLRGAHGDGSTWEITRTILTTRRRP